MCPHRFELFGELANHGGLFPTFFAASIEVTDDFGTDLFDENIRVPSNEPAPVAPVASFTWEVIEPGVVEFTNTSVAQDDANVRWRTTGVEGILVRQDDRYVVEFPAEGGLFTATITVTDDFGADVFEEQIRVPASEP